jgi:hypothetical protein
MTFAFEETTIDGAPLEIIVRETLTEIGLKRIVAANSPTNLGKMRGESIDVIGRGIASLSPVKTKGPVHKRTASAKIAKRKSKAVKAAPAGKWVPNYWNRVKSEFYNFICTNDKKYAAVRSQLNAKHTQTAFVSIISVAVGSQSGVGAGAATPLVALLLIGALQVGVNAFCQEFEHLKLE